MRGLMNFAESEPGRIQDVESETTLPASAVIAIRETYTSKYLGLAFGFFLAVVTLILNSKWIQNSLYGDNFERNEFLWYVIMVPTYTTTFVFTVRYWGTYFLSIWIRELVGSDFVHSSIITLVKYIISDQRMSRMLQEQMMNDDVLDSVVDIVESVLSNEEVQIGTSKLVSQTLRNPKVSDATMNLSVRVMRSRGILDATGTLLDNANLTPAACTQLSNILSKRLLHEATVRFLQSLTQDGGIRSRFKDRTKSFVQDPSCYEAMGRGMYQAAFGPRSQTSHE